MILKDRIKIELEEYLNKDFNSEDDRIILLDDETIETESYYVFFYINRKFLETGDFSYRLVGNAPIIVDKQTGNMHLTGTAYPLEVYIREYEEKMIQSRKQ